MRDVAIRNVAAVGSTRKKLIIPAFTLAATWSGVSQLLARYSIGNTNKFSFKRPVEQPNETFVAAVSWSESPYVYRYKFSSGLGEILYFPDWNGEQIGINAYFEIWSVAGATLSATTADWELRVSKLILPTLFPIHPTCLENEESQTLVPVVSETLPPSQYCNCFCTPLCT